MTKKDVPEMVRLAKDIGSDVERFKGYYLKCALIEMAVRESSTEALTATLKTMFDLGYAHGVKTAQVKRN